VRRPQVVHLTLPADRPPWTATGVRVAAGDEVTLLGSGFVRWSPRGDAGAGAKYHLWGRVSGGPAFGCTQDTHTAVAECDGELELCVYRGAWADRYGTLATGEEAYRSGSGGLEVTVVRWPRGLPAAEGLRTVGDVDPALARAELRRLAAPVAAPTGWSHLPEFGPSEIFRAGEVDGRPAIEVVCDDDIGILTTPVRRALTPSTRLEWSWRVDALPSTRREDRIWSHDYLSIAVEFGDGRDLTWFWSAELPAGGGGFACPAPRWRDRERHVPVRCGTAGLGTWLAESRNVWDDVTRFGIPPAERVVGVWLIAVSHFARSLGRATFRDIRLVDDGGTVQVL
jgi:Protein of unknown function (DUF3047)